MFDPIKNSGVTLLELTKEIVRSSLTGIGFVGITSVIVYSVLTGEIKVTEIPSWYTTLVGVMVAFWFSTQQNHKQ